MAFLACLLVSFVLVTLQQAEVQGWEGVGGLGLVQA